MRKPTLFITLMCIGLSTQKIVAQPTTKADPSSRIEGTYQVTRMAVFAPGQPPKVLDLNQPGNKLSAVITAKRKSQRYVSLTFSQSQNAIQMLSFRYGDAYLRTTSKGYDLAIDGNKVGTTDGHNLTMNISAVSKKGEPTSRTLLVCKRS